MTKAFPASTQKSCATRRESWRSWTSRAPTALLQRRAHRHPCSSGRGQNSNRNDNDHQVQLQDSLEEDFQRHQYESATAIPHKLLQQSYFLERLPSEFAFAKRHDKPVSLAMMDIDRFKKINDSMASCRGFRLTKDRKHAPGKAAS